jgi:hypothetical protein
MPCRFTSQILLNLAAAVMACLSAPATSAGVLDTQSNPVALNFADTPLWTNPSKWDGFPKYAVAGAA